MGTLGIDAIQRMQRLAGVETLEQRLARLDAERERMISDAKRSDDDAAEQWKAERKALTEEINVAEQPVVPSKQRKNIWNYIKSLINEL
jgi:cell division septum initiation protein DivIVA